MGEATPAQSAAGTFVPMLGVGLGAMSGGVGVGGGPVVVPPGSRGSNTAVPQLHNAIVERLRARIELCRRHHNTCESRYQRGQAESTDREHESTLHLLNIVQQGPGNRKAKGGSRASNQQPPHHPTPAHHHPHPPPEYGRANGDKQDGDQKINTRIALQGSLRRKIEGHAPGPGPKQNGVSCGFSGSDFKRVRVDPGALGHGPCHHNLNQSHSLQGSTSNMGMQRKNYMMPHGVGSDIFNMTLKEMKKEPTELHQSCGQSHAEMIFDFKDEANQIDPDLQDLFDELTKTVPTFNDLELEKMLKQDDTFGLDLGRPSSAGAAASLCSPMDKPIKLEHSPDFGQVCCGSPQLRPASAGPSFTLTGTSSTNTKANTPQAGHPRAMPCWPEISHAEQLKQMAANQQQPNALLHHHHNNNNQTPPSGGLTSWAPAMTTHSSTNAFSQDKVSGPGPLSQQRMVNQSKGINNCLFKSNGHNGNHHLDMKVLSTKPTLHFSPKAAPHPTGQGIPIMGGTVNKTPAQQQVPSTGQNQTHPALHFQNQQISTAGGLCLQPKTGPTGLPFKLAQQRQGVPSGPRLPNNLGGMASQTQPRQPAPNNQQKGPVKTPVMHRQINQQQHNISNSDKDNAHDQFSRHLTRPPPDYKQSRSMVGVQQGNMFTGQNPPQSSTNGPDNSLQSVSCHLPGGPGSKMNPSPSDRRFNMGTECHPGSLIGQFQQQQQQQHNNSNNQTIRMGLNQNKARFLGPPNAHRNSFPMNNSLAHSSTSTGVLPGGVQGLGGLIKSVNMGWGSANKQVTTPGLGIRRMPNPLQPQSAQMDMPNHPNHPNHPYHQPQQPQRLIGPPNQVAPDIGMLPLRDTGSRTAQSNMLRSAVGNLNQASPEQRVPANNFAEPSPRSASPISIGSSISSISSYQSNRGHANRLTFDFLPEGDNTVPGINTDSDFIDSLLKSGSSGNDDWMKDINLDEILGGHS